MLGVGAEDLEAPVAGERHPDLMDDALAGEVGEGEDGVRGDEVVRGDLPVMALVAHIEAAGALGGAAALASGGRWGPGLMERVCATERWDSVAQEEEA